MQTIAPYLTHNKQQAIIFPALAEMCWQEEGQDQAPSENWPSVAMEIPADIEDNFINPEKIRPSDDETYSDGLCRLQQCVQLIKKHQDSCDTNLILVCHGYTSGLIIDQLCSMPLQNHIHHDNTGISYLEYNDNTWNILYINRL